MSGSGDSEPSSDGCVQQLRIVLGRFDPLIGVGLVHMLGLEQSLRIIDYGLNETELKRTIMQQAPDVAVLDAPGTIEPSQLKSFRTAYPEVGLVILADDPSHIHSAARGVSLLSKKASLEAVLSAVYHAAEGGHVPVPRSGTRQRRRKDPQALTAREQEVREALRSGEPFEVLAARLHITPETFKRHARNVRHKLGVRTRWHLADPSQLQRERRQPMNSVARKAS